MDKNLSQYIDHTLLKAQATPDDIITLINEAKQYQFKAICINPCYVELAKKHLQNSKVKICTVIGFPLGATTLATKVHEAIEAITLGASEIDMVINIGALKAGNNDLVLKEIKAVRSVCKNGIILKVIIETGLLSLAEKIIACKLVSQAKADFIKTATGFNTGATVADIELMKNHIDPNIAIKASGAIRNKQQALGLLKAGASRIGTSNSVAIIKNELATQDY